MADFEDRLRHIENERIHADTSKTPIVDLDEFEIADSAASFGYKKVTWATIKATIKTYTDTLYATVSHVHALLMAPLASTGDLTVTAGYGALSVEYFEIGSGKYLELGAGAIMEVT